jgi:3',5'-cyclic AMP phosphodiesterase CpdA
VTIKIAHISDTHSTQGKDFIEASFNIASGTINMSDADLVVHTGDITGSGLKEEFPLAKRHLSAIEKPMVVVIGNHDSRNVGHELFEEFIGPIRGVYTDEELDLALIWIDSTVPDRNEGRVGSLHYSWLQNQLKEHRRYKHKLVALHHHLVPVPRAGRERNVLNNAGDLLDLFIKYDLKLVLCGHRHFPNVYHVEDMVVSNAGCMSCRKTRMGDINSYNWVELDEDETRVEVRRLDGDLVSYPPVRPSRRIFPAPERRMIRIGHISGSYIGPEGYVEEKLDNAIRKLNSLSPDVVVHCGNIVSQGREEDYLMAIDKLRAIKAPMLFTAGPRDLNYLGHYLWPRHFGSLWHNHTSEDLFIQGVQTAQYDTETGVVGIWARKELDNVLIAHEDRLRAVFMHHNVVPIPHIRELGLLEDAGDLLSGFTRAGVDLVLTGCSSHPYAIRIGETLIVNANTLSAPMFRTPFGCSFNVIDVYEDAILVQEFHSLWGSRRTLGIWPRKDAGLPKDVTKERERTRRERLVGRIR